MIKSPLLRQSAHFLADPRLSALLSDAPRIGPDRHWQGEFEGTRGACKGSSLHISAHIAFHGTLLEGNGRFTNPPEPSWDDRIALAGTGYAGAVDFQVWFSAQAFRPSPFACSGRLSVDEREMTGTWSFACFNPDSCGCNGGGGTFELRRID